MNWPLNTLVGQEIERTEDIRFLRGTGTFTDDYEPEGTVHVAILRSSVAHGILCRIDKSEALRMTGVHAVIDASDIVTNPGTIPTIPLRLAPIEGFDKLNLDVRQAANGFIGRQRMPASFRVVSHQTAQKPRDVGRHTFETHRPIVDDAADAVVEEQHMLAPNVAQARG